MNDITNVRDFIYTVPESVLFNNELTIVDLKIYMIVRSFMDTRGDAYPSNSWIAKKVGIQPRSVPRSLERLEKYGHLTRLLIKGKRHLMVGNVIAARHLQEAKVGVTDESWGDDSPVMGGDDSPVIQLDQNNIISKIINNEDKKPEVLTPRRPNNVEPIQKPTMKRRLEALTSEQRNAFDRLVAFKGVYRGAALVIVENHNLNEVNNALEAAKLPTTRSAVAHILGTFFKKQESNSGKVS